MPAFQAGDAGSIPATRTTYAPVAQWIEQKTSKLLAVGSNPTRGTIANHRIKYSNEASRLQHMRL